MASTNFIIEENWTVI